MSTRIAPARPHYDWDRIAMLAALVFLAGLCVWQRLGVIEPLIREKADLTGRVAPNPSPTPREAAIYRIEAEGLLTMEQRIALLRAEEGLPPMPPWDPKHDERTGPKRRRGDAAVPADAMRPALNLKGAVK